jgi:hypothetical protein
MRTTGLSLAQAPHLSVPTGFFLAVPLSLVVAGSIVLFAGADAFSSPWNPHIIALTHVGTIGVLMMGMMGALYQMIPVVVGTPVPAIRLAHGVQALLLIGLACFAWRMLGGTTFAMTLANVTLGLALLGFLLPVGWSLANAATHNETTQGMRLALISLATIVVLGLLMARGYSGSGFPENRFIWTQIHLTLALLGWVGGLIMSVSWQVIPMFYVAPPASKATRRIMLMVLLAGLVLPFTVFMTPDNSAAIFSSARFSASQWAASAALPAALVIWIMHPLLTLFSIARRKRTRSDASLLFWRAGLASALTLTPLAVAAVLIEDNHWSILFGWLAIWGWAGMILHGMLMRIVPFLVWFHRIAPLIGKTPVPSMRGLLSQRRIMIGFSIHLATGLLGAAAIITHSDILVRITGVLLAATGISLASSLYRALFRSWRHASKGTDASR